MHMWNKEMKFRNYTCLVLGGAGFIGSHLVDFLVSQKSQIYVVDNLSRGKAQNLQHCIDKINFIEYDLRKDFPKFGTDIDYVFDFAATIWGITNLYTQPATLLSNNVRIASNVLESVKNWNLVKYVYISSSCRYNFNGAKFPHKEEDLGYVKESYDWSKIFGEELCRAYGKEFKLPYSIVVPFNVYGGRESLDYPHVIPDFIKQAKEVKEKGLKEFKILGSGEQTRCFTYIDDCIEGIIDVATKGRNREAYNIGSNIEVKVIDLAKMILKEFKLESIKIKSLPKIEGDIQRRIPSIEKAKIYLNWKPKTSLEDGLKKTIQWYMGV